MVNHVPEMPAIHLTLELGSSQGTWGGAGPQTHVTCSFPRHEPSLKHALSPHLCRLQNAISLFPFK